jgi:hypothetical protein
MYFCNISPKFSKVVVAPSVLCQNFTFLCLSFWLQSVFLPSIMVSTIQRACAVVGVLAICSWIILSSTPTPLGGESIVVPIGFSEASSENPGSMAIPPDERETEAPEEENSTLPTNRPLSNISPQVVELNLDEAENAQYFTALPLSSPLVSAIVGPERSLLFRSRSQLVSDVADALADARVNPAKSSYKQVSGRASNESFFDWTVNSEVFKTAEDQCLVVVTLSRPRSHVHDKYREMVNENEEWEQVIANDVGPDAFRLIARSTTSVEVGTTVFASAGPDEDIISYLGIVKITTPGSYQVEVEHLHRAFGAFTDVDRRGSYCPLPPSPGKGRNAHRAQRIAEFDNRVREKEGRRLVDHRIDCNSITSAPLPTVLPLCSATTAPQDLLDGRYIPAAAALSGLPASKSKRNFSILGESFLWAPRSCRMQYFSSVNMVGELRKRLSEKQHKVLFLGDSQMRTLVNAYFSIVYNEPPAENNRGEYRKYATISSSTSSETSSTLEFLWDPQGEIITRFDLIMDRKVRHFERALKRFLITKKLMCRRGQSSLDIAHTKKKRKPTSIIDLPASCYTPEGFSWLGAWKYGRRTQIPSVVVVGFGGWNVWLCESFQEAEERLTLTVKSVKLLRDRGTEVIFVGWPAPIDSLSITASKRRMTSSRIGMLLELTRLELASCGVVVLPFFEMALPFPLLSSKASASHYDNSTILYGIADYISTFL